MDRVIRIKIIKHQGKNHYYALDHAEDLKTLTGTKALTYSHIQALKNLGFTFTVEPEVV